MARYQRDPERRRMAALIDAEVERAREAEKEGGWITYLIRDPRTPDKRSNPAGTPIYVGQSKEFGTRVRSRFDKCEKEATKKDSIERRVADLLHAGVVVRYEVLERTPTRLASLVSETNWARQCINRGYDIANRLPEQRVGGPPVGRYDIPVSWLWRFTLEEGIEDGIDVELRCLNCGLNLRIGLSHFQSLAEPPQALFHIKSNRMWRSEPCTECGERRKRYVALHVC